MKNILLLILTICIVGGTAFLSHQYGHSSAVLQGYAIGFEQGYHTGMSDATAAYESGGAIVKLTDKGAVEIKKP